MSFLITGCGRSGTGWAARLFTGLGFPCSHEGQFNLATHGPLRGGESSWLAIPHLDSLDPSIRLLRIVRDPYEVVQSVMARGFLLNTVGPYEQYTLKHCPLIGYGNGHLSRAIRWVDFWDRPLDWRAHETLFCNDPATGLVNSVLHATGEEMSISKVLAVMDEIGTRTNTNVAYPIGRHIPTREEIDAHPEGARVRRRAERFGYA